MAPKTQEHPTIKRDILKPVIIMSVKAIMKMRKSAHMQIQIQRAQKFCLAEFK